MSRIILAKEDVKAILNYENVEGWKIHEEGDWVDDGKYSFRAVVLMCNATGKYYSVSQSRSGSYFSDYHYEDLAPITKNDEVAVKQVMVERWESVPQEKILLEIDADVLVHKVSRAAEHQVRWPNGLWSWYASEDDAKAILAEYMYNLENKLDADKVVMCLSSDTNFREGVYVDYKANRKDTDSYPPILKQFLREYISENYETYIKDGLEADDLLGIHMTDPEHYGDYKKILCTIDKDLDTIEGYHYNLDKGDENGVYFVDKEAADRFFHEQILTGDRVDNIPGCKGYGPKTAQKLINSVDKSCLWDEIVKAYVSKGGTEEDALMNARLVRILTNDLYDKQNDTVILWQRKMV